MKKTLNSIYRMNSPIAWLCMLGATACFLCGTINAAALPEQKLTALETAFAEGRWHEITPAAVSSVLAPRDADAWMGYACLAQGQTDTANGHFLRARSGDRNEIQKSDQRIPLLEADALVRSGDFEGAIGRLESVSVSSRNFPVAKFCESILLVNQGKGNMVSNDLASVGEALSTEACVVRGLALWKAGELTTALTELEQAVLFDPADGIAWNSLGVVQAQSGDWPAAAREFELAFRLLPDLAEARDNWRLADGRVASRGTTLTSTRGIGEITIVSASEAGNLRSETQIASEIVRKQFGAAPLVTKDLAMAKTLSASGPVILQRNDSGLNSVAGDGMLKTLRDLGPKPDIHVMSFGYDSSEKATMGILRYQNTTPKPDQAHIASVHLLDPSEVEGPAGKTPFVQTDLKSLAANASLIGQRGVPVAVYTPQDKIGLQHIGNVKYFQDQKGVDLFVTPWQGHLETGLGLVAGKSPVGLSLGVQGASDKVVNREIATRDWTVFKNGTQQQFTGEITDLAKGYFNSGLGIAKAASQFNDRGGITIDAGQMRSEAGHVVFGGKSARPVKLKLVYPVFCIVEEVEVPNN